MTTQQVANAFMQGRKASAHNARTDGKEYRLFGHVIARREDDGVTFDWCGWHTVSTARHMNAILNAMGAAFRVRYVSSTIGKRFHVAEGSGVTTVLGPAGGVPSGSEYSTDYGPRMGV